MPLGELTTEELLENFDLFEDWEERYRYLIDLGRKLPAFPESAKNDTNKVDGCISQVWMTADVSEETPPRIILTADSDAHIVKGLIAVLLVVYSHKTAAEVRAVDINAVFEQLELGSHISVNRRNGFYAMVERIKQFAAA
ncbi:SufE family protein [Acanthopleuribacter pedis]|uniref:SufE family protein n=1 Tax=Acanthopleuribacter pedis TaxID=442870 RepID=A0A8J7QGW6_9BACT|nr:SufE family protein [Acanthopleuribacter pedis]MBO1318370.1 SufE family protein [Acanthopleuribacter pedis]